MVLRLFSCAPKQIQPPTELQEKQQLARRLQNSITTIEQVFANNPQELDQTVLNTLGQLRTTTSAQLNQLNARIQELKKQQWTTLFNKNPKLWEFICNHPKVTQRALHPFSIVIMSTVVGASIGAALGGSLGGGVGAGPGAGLGVLFGTLAGFYLVLRFSETITEPPKIIAYYNATHNNP